MRKNKNKDGLRPLAPGDLDGLQTDESGHLYWRGRRVRCGGFTLSDGASVASILLVVVILLANLEAVLNSLGAFVGIPPAGP